MTMLRTIGALTLAAGTLAACAGTTETAGLQQATAAYQAVSTDPTVTTNAPLEVRRAEEALRRAQNAAAEGESERTVNHLSYLATRRAQIAEETAGVKRAQAVAANPNEVRLAVRNQELERQLRDLQARRTERGLVMTLGDVLFATGSADLTAGAETRIQRLARFLEGQPGRTVRIEGYTDATGSSETNLRLSERRAESVRAALLAQGVNPTRVTTRGFGEAQPVASNSTDAGRQQNRRVEIVISDDGRVAETR